MKEKEINTFNKLLKLLFKLFAVNINNLILNGSFRSSYWSSDIDLYEPLNKFDITIIRNKINEISKNYKITEIKVQTDKRANKYWDAEKIKFPENETIIFVKIDTIIYFMLFPLECSIIYDYQPERQYNFEIVIEELLTDAIKPENNLYKSIKRLDTICNEILGYDNVFWDILNNTKLGVLYLCSNRLKFLPSLRKQIPEKTYKKYYYQIHDDLRKYGVKIGEQDEVLDREIKKYLENMTN